MTKKGHHLKWTILLKLLLAFEENDLGANRLAATTCAGAVNFWHGLGMTWQAWWRIYSDILVGVDGMIVIHERCCSAEH